MRLGDASAIQAVQSLEAPLLLIHGQADSQIPVEHSQKIAEYAPPDLTELWIIPGADHGQAHYLGGAHYESRIRNFFDRHL